MAAKITTPTQIPPVIIARILERQGSPLAPLAEEIYDLAINYRIDAAFALAQWMVQSRLGCALPAQVNRSAALVPLVVARRPAPGGPLRPVGTTPILPPRYSDEHASGYVTYPGWLAGLEDYFRILRAVFVDAWHEDRVQDVAHAFLAGTPGRRAVPPQPHPKPAGTPALQAAAPVSQREIDDYARRVSHYRALFQNEGRPVNG